MLQAGTISNVTEIAANAASHQLVSLIESAESCEQLGHCRTIWDIVWSCAGVVVVCIWHAVHPDVPPLKLPERRTDLRASVYEKTIITFIAFLAPEAIFLWAVIQRMHARSFARLLNEAHVPAPKYDKYWTKTHGFFILMGGLHASFEGKSEFALPLDDVIKLLVPAADATSKTDATPTSLQPALGDEFMKYMPSEAEIMDRSKNDWIAKAIALSQILWFSIQFFSRVNRFEITHLEIATLAYAVITFGTYIAWLGKPLGVEQPILITFTKDMQVGELDIDTAESDEQKYTKVPVLTGGDPKRRLGLISSYKLDGTSQDRVFVVIAIVAMVGFGAIHCCAWNFHFPSDPEKWLWRVSTIVMTATSLGIVVAGSLAAIIAVSSSKAVRIIPTLERSQSTRKRRATIATRISRLLALVYVASRLILFVLVFTTLRSLTVSAHKIVHWVFFLPGIFGK